MFENLFKEDGTLDTGILEQAMRDIAAQTATEQLESANINNEINELKTTLTGVQNRTNNEIKVIKETIKGIDNHGGNGSNENSLTTLLNNMKGGK